MIYLKLFITLLGIAFVLSCSRVVQNNSTSPVGTNIPSPDAVRSTELNQLDFSSVDSILENAAPQFRGGLGFILVSNTGVIYRKAYGGYDLERVLPIASSTKWLSGAMLMSLVDEGKLSLDDPVSKFLPAFTGDKSGITVRQLFSHTSGLPAEAPCRNNKRTSLEQCVNEIAGMRLNSQPGTKFFYGGVSMHAGGRLVEIVAGKPWNDVFMERIAAPLQLSKTDYYAYGQTQNPRPAGDGRSTLDEYARFLMMMLNGGSFEGRRILSQNAVIEMHKDQTSGSEIEYTIFGDKGHLDPRLPKATYGVGMWREVYTGQENAPEVSSPGALGSYPWIDFQRGVGGMILTNNTFSRSLPIYLEVKKRTLQIIDERGSKKD
jgi:CubicO group peptidase (beta-lactamase class C family)